MFLMFLSGWYGLSLPLKNIFWGGEGGGRGRGGGELNFFGPNSLIYEPILKILAFRCSVRGCQPPHLKFGQVRGRGVEGEGFIWS